MYNSVKIELRIYSERYFAEQTFIGHHTDIPNIDFLIILNPHNDFRRVIKWTAD